MHPPLEKPVQNFEEYEEVPETVPLDFSENHVMWITSNLSGAARELGAKEIELIN